MGIGTPRPPPPPVQGGPVIIRLPVWMVALAADCPREPQLPCLCTGCLPW